MSEQNKTPCKCNLCNKPLSRVIFIKNGFNLVKCSFCGLVYVNNPPSEAELQKLYSFDVGYHAEFQYDDSQCKKHFDHLGIADHHYKLVRKYKEQGRLLDIGCSAGFFLKVARDNGWETYGLEMSKDTAELARKRYGHEVISGTLHENTYKPKYFDVITMWDVLEHVENPIKTMSIVNRILKDDGIVVLSTPNIDGLFPKASYGISKIINYWPHPEPPYHLFQFSKDSISKLLMLTGFDLLETGDERYSIKYVFGSLKDITKSIKKFLYSAVFIPIILIGPIIHSGDLITVIAKKVRKCETKY